MVLAEKGIGELTALQRAALRRMQQASHLKPGDRLVTRDPQPREARAS